MKLIANLEYVTGHLRSGYLEWDVPEGHQQLIQKLLDENNQKELKLWMRDNADIIIDDYRIDDRGEIEEVKLCK